MLCRFAAFAFLASILATSAFAQDAPAAKCDAVAEITKANPEGSRVARLSDVQFSMAKAVLAAHESPMPDNIVGAVVGQLPDQTTSVFLFGLKADGCIDGHVQVGLDVLKEIVGAAA